MQRKKKKEREGCNIGQSAHFKERNILFFYFLSKTRTLKLPSMSFELDNIKSELEIQAKSKLVFWLEKKLHSSARALSPLHGSLSLQTSILGPGNLQPRKFETYLELKELLMVKVDNLAAGGKARHQDSA
ncbi:Uncharacterized protein TCM_039683 [Theobroma cacao]|uniref:Uncharacterized protein n=1 Tax=Theobroma cacao TaxID=3641 RepID=A0A061GSK9_THECC|nr:Uncharacterized protein TCM_039683 [Theobroma cacao]